MNTGAPTGDPLPTQTTEGSDAGGSPRPGPDFQQLVDRFYQRLYRFGYSLSRNRDDACDLVQQTFVIWARHGHALRDEARAKSWLFTTLFREFLKLHRMGTRVIATEESELDTHAGDLDSDRIDRMDGETVMAALQGVPMVFRVPLTLFYLEELSYDEIASVLAVPIGTVMSRLSRGKEHLRRFLDQTTLKPSGGAVAPAVARRSAASSVMKRHSTTKTTVSPRALPTRMSPIK